MRSLQHRMGLAWPLPTTWRFPMLTRIVRPSPALESFLGSLRLDLSQPQHDHLLQLVDGLLVCDESKTLAALQRQFLDSTDSSNWADFLRISPWSAEAVRTALRRHQVEWLVAEAQRRGLPRSSTSTSTTPWARRTSRRRTWSRSTGSTITTNPLRASPLPQGLLLPGMHPAGWGSHRHGRSAALPPRQDGAATQSSSPF